MLLYFLRGSLPWQGLTATDQTQKEELILEEKRKINTGDLCEDLPQEFAVYFDYIRSLNFDQKPKYSYLRKIFRDLFVREGFDYDHVYDWTILEYLRRKKLSNVGVSIIQNLQERKTWNDNGTRTIHNSQQA